MENQEIKVSVIIPIYNVQDYLHQCLDSVINQTLKEIEIICVDDESPDDSMAIVEKYAEKDNRIRILRQKNAGAGAARNKGLAVAKGKYLSILDSDDFFELDMLEVAYKQAEADKADFVAFQADRYSTEKKEYIPMKWAFHEKELPPYTPFNHRQMTGNIFRVFVGWAWDKLYSREFVECHQLTFQEQRTTNDMLFVFSATVLAKRISYVKKVLVHQRFDSKDSLSKTREKSWDCFYKALIALRERIVREGYYKEVERDYINYALHFTFWNLDTLAEPTHTILKDKLNSEWLKELGIEGKPAEYYYEQKNYEEYLAIKGEAANG